MVHQLQESVKPSVSRLRSVASQVIACTSPNLLLLDLAMAVGFATIAVPELLNAKEGLSLNETQASWFGSIAFLTQPVGALLSGPIVDYLGRKKANFVVNIPHVIAWILMYYAWNIPSLFLANCLLGFGTGIMEAPINSYVGEVSEPSTRGALSTMIQASYSFGTLLIFFLGMVVTWRTAALISLAIPVVAMCLVLLLPETPVWFLSQGRHEEALQSLCYLRGWTTPEHVKEEYDQLVAYTKEMQKCIICIKTGVKSKECEHEKLNIFVRGALKFKHLMLCRETMGPLALVLLYFFFYDMSGIWPIRSNMENVCKAFGMAQDGKTIVLFVGIITFVTSVFLMWVVKVLGKRKLGISSLLATAICGTGLSIYAKINLPDSVFSYDTDTFLEGTSYVPLTIFYIMIVFTGVALPWLILGEVFPFRSRASAQGIAAAGNYVIMFLASKTLIDIEVTIHLSGAFAVYAAFGYLGVIYLYFFLPETEGKTLEEIEAYYSGKVRTFADDPFINTIKKLKP